MRPALAEAMTSRFDPTSGRLSKRKLVIQGSKLIIRGKFGVQIERIDFVENTQNSDYYVL